MANDAWKVHERHVAKYFNTTRRLRGANFSQEDIEIIATLNTWLGIGYEEYIGVAVECKYRKKHPLIDLLIKHQPESAPTYVARVGNYILCWLESFEEVFKHFIYPPNGNSDIDTISMLFNIVTIDKEVPQYLNEYRDQAKGYTEVSTDNLLPIVCMAKSRSSHRLVAVHIDDIDKFRSKYSPCPPPKLPQSFPTPAQ